jgi:guanylate cyclase
MESHGQSGMIQITRNTFELVRDEFVCEPKGMVRVKGAGEMEAWHVLGRKPRAVVTQRRPEVPS